MSCFSKPDMSCVSLSLTHHSVFTQANRTYFPDELLQIERSTEFSLDVLSVLFPQLSLSQSGWMQVCCCIHLPLILFLAIHFLLFHLNVPKNSSIARELGYLLSPVSTHWHLFKDWWWAQKQTYSSLDLPFKIFYPASFWFPYLASISPLLFLSFSQFYHYNICITPAAFESFFLHWKSLNSSIFSRFICV